jgi:hypothetical protein
MVEERKVSKGRSKKSSSMIETICRVREMPLKDDEEASNIVVKNEEIHENDVVRAVTMDGTLEDCRACQY